MNPRNSPLAALSQAHESTLRQCEALGRLLLYLGQCEPDAQSRRITADLLDFFDTLAPLHGQEEELLYPALIEAVAGSGASCLHEMACSLTEQHRLLEGLWGRLRQHLLAIATGESRPGVITDAEAFIRLARFHVASEEDEVLPMALRLIQDDELARIRDAIASGGPGRVSAAAAAAAAPSCTVPA